MSQLITNGIGAAALTAAEIKAAYEGQPDTNPLTDTRADRVDRVPVFFDDVAAVLSDGNTFSAGTVLKTRREGFSYVCTDTTGNLGQNTAGGQALNVIALGNALNAKAFGATGDGVTDDTDALQAWINASQNGSGYLPEGTYHHTGLTFDPQFSYNIIGEAYDKNLNGGSRLHNMNVSGGAAITIDNTPFAGNFDSQMRFANLLVSGNAASGDGFYVNQTMVQLENVWISGHGGHGYQAIRCYSSAFRQVSFSNNQQSGFAANRALNAVHFDHCLFNGNAESSGFAGCSLSGAAAEDRNFGVTFTSCDFTGNGVNLTGADVAYGLVLQHASGVNVIGCYAESNYTYNLYADSTVYGLNVIGGFWQDKHVFLSEVNGLHFVGNEIYDSGSGTARLSLNAGLPDKRLSWDVKGTTFTGSVTKSFSGGATEVSEWHDTAPPTGGTWKRGDKVWNSNAQNGGAIVGWACIVSGTPGTWLPLGVLPQVFTNHGDAGATLTVGSSFPTNIWQSPLTADRTVTLSTTNAYSGAKFRITRTGGATGAFSLIIGATGKNLAVGEWCDVEFSASGWIVTASGVI
ncbi:glycosyl hydrolase family 28-related protein [Yoonia sp.]|uniref:glycosyl hydrolase family 28-related protein n=1 Tax=Yoonia sp. TaxID=2212373 RepID=UPI002E0B2823|nr:glycosyl hydrolase family 28-related protein [Yoonia sp.]